MKSEKVHWSTALAVRCCSSDEDLDGDSDWMRQSATCPYVLKQKNEEECQSLSFHQAEVCFVAFYFLLIHFKYSSKLISLVINSRISVLKMEVGFAQRTNLRETVRTTQVVHLQHNLCGHQQRQSHSVQLQALILVGCLLMPLKNCTMAVQYSF